MTRIGDQERAAYAWRCVQQGCSRDYVNLAKAAPALVMNNGLMQTLAFYQAKGKDHHSELLKHIMGWLRRSNALQSDDFRTVMASLTQVNSVEFRRCTEETLAVLRWIRQFAAAVGQP